MKYALVGTGSRSELFISALTNKYGANHDLVGICDTNPQRIRYYQDFIARQKFNRETPGFLSQDFDDMILTTRPDFVIVTTVDALHHEYIIRSLRLGCNVITEKPMTTSGANCREIIKAVDETGLDVKVAFNYRWGSGVSRGKELLQGSAIGRIHHVSLQYLLDTDHGADYFRRWHRNREMSGGLIIHKATHHFDLVNWWIDSVPSTVYGAGKLAFYGNNNGPSEIYGEDRNYGYGIETSNPFDIDLSSSKKLDGLYLQAQRHDGYRRDQDVFSEGISIEDTMSVVVKYRSGVHLSYSLVAYSSMEGFVVTFHGDSGRLHYEEIHRQRTRIDKIGRAIDTDEDQWSSKVTLQKIFEPAVEEIIESSEGGHGGADPQMLDYLFAASKVVDYLGRNAGHQQGAASMLIGDAANKSFQDGREHSIEDICPELGTSVRLSELV